jgi:GT2 family glycosyltransferase
MNRDHRSISLTSVIIPCWDQIQFTQQCFAALKEHTRPAWELIVIDNGSTDGTATYLAGARDMAPVPVTIVTNSANLGFPAAINQGLQLARGDYLVLLNNDVVVTDGWLDQLIGFVNAKRGSTAEHAGRKVFTEGTSVESGAGSRDPRTTGGAGDSGRPTPPGPPFTKGGKVLMSAGSRDPRTTRRIGLVGPMSNYAAPPQLIENVPYHDLSDMRDFARQWRDQHRGKWFSVPKLSGFCLLMKRAVYDKIGGLDERFGLGFFDDDDLAERARRAGFELAVAHDLFVHHFGSRTFAGNGVDAGQVLDENARRFAAKWGLQKANGKPVTLQPWLGEGNGIATQPEPAQRQRLGPPHSQTRSASFDVALF